MDELCVPGTGRHHHPAAAGVLLRPSDRKAANIDITRHIAKAAAVFLSVPLATGYTLGWCVTGAPADILFSIFLMYEFK
jgi:hypothetical protein